MIQIVKSCCSFGYTDPFDTPITAAGTGVLSYACSMSDRKGQSVEQIY